MTRTQEEIQGQLTLLGAHRRTLQILLQQQAQHGSMYAPPAIIIGIQEARANIRIVKAALASWNVHYEDNPNDEESLLGVSYQQSVDKSLTNNISENRPSPTSGNTIPSNVEYRDIQSYLNRLDNLKSFFNTKPDLANSNSKNLFLWRREVIGFLEQAYSKDIALDFLSINEKTAIRDKASRMIDLCQSYRAFLSKLTK
jgi:hypothetical protein